MGTVIAAVSPAVIVPKMLKLMEEGYGVKKSIPQMILAGASVDDVFVIVMFTAFTGLIPAGETAAMTVPIIAASKIEIPSSLGANKTIPPISKHAGTKHIKTAGRPTFFRS